VRLLARPIIRTALGGDFDRRLLPVAGVAFTYNASFSTFWVYVGVFAVDGLGWRPGSVGVLFLVSAPAAAVANYFSGRLSDRVGPKPLILASFLASSGNVAALAWVSGNAAVAFALIVVQGVLGAPAYSLDRVLVAELVPEREGRETGYASVRVAANLGIFAGPPLAALLIQLGGWTVFLIGVAALGVLGATLTAVFLPATRRDGGRATGASVSVLLGDRPFALLLLSTLLGFVVYCGFETVLPVLAVSAYGISASTWGLLVAISPLLVVLFQLRLTRATAAIPPAPRLAAAMVLMGLPFLLLVGGGSVLAIAAVVVVFVTGEMLWVPTFQAVAAQLAPIPVRGTYFGALAAMTGPAWTLSPLIALELRQHAGLAAVWVLFAGVAVAGAICGLAAVRAAAAREPVGGM
jgi:MFS family permease